MPSSAQRVDEEGDGPPAHDGHTVDERHQPGEGVARGGERPRERRVVDDRCERAVEVDQNHGVPRVIDERLEQRPGQTRVWREGRAYVVPTTTMQLASVGSLRRIRRERP